MSILNDPPQDLIGPELLHDLIDFQEYSDSCAIDFKCIGERRQYTYGEVQSCVASLVTRIGNFLTTNETQKGQPSTQHVVPVMLPQSPGLYITQLAILFSGGAFCPINLDAPKERIKFVVGDVSADFIITTSEFKDSVTWENGPTIITVDQLPAVPEKRESNIRKLRQASSRDLAYVMYTSGSSGTPKGVAVSHLAVTQSLLAHEKLLPVFKRFLQFAAPSFDVSVFEIFFPLTRGCTIVGCDRNQLLNDLPGMMNELNVDAAELTPTVAGSLLQKRSNAPKLRLLLTIGEMLTRPIVEEFGGSETQESMLYGMYGPTEAAIHCTIHPKMKADSKPGNIGVPFETVSTFIAATSLTSNDAEALKFLAAGELGELVLGGSQLAQGYLNREEQNKTAFITSEGKRYYRTGDKARILEDGSIEILGRISSGQVKLRGQRIELGEIEEAVYKHPEIKTVVAVVLNGSLIVFALTDDVSLKSKQITDTCAKWLPKFMVPTEIILLQAFPYLPSGKVDKRRLETEYQRSFDGHDDETDSSAMPTTLLVETILRDLLGPFSRKMRLAAAGLDSLVAIRVASKLRDSGLYVTTVEILQADTLSDLTKLCEAAKFPEKKIPNKLGPKNDELVASSSGHFTDVECIVACTPLQLAMLSETTVNSNAYMNWVELELQGISDTDQVISALEHLAELNAILRTGFAESRGTDGFVQIVWKQLLSSQFANVRKFDYDFGQSVRMSFHRPLHIQVCNAGSSTKLLIHLHHALYDAWSLELLLDDLDDLLIGETTPSRPNFQSIVEAYQDGTLDGSISTDYWKDHLSDLDIRQIPNFHSSKEIYSGLAITTLQTRISTSDVESAAKSLSSSPQSLFQAAFALVLSSYLGTSDICFGTVFSGRTLPIENVEDIIGPCLATLPIRVDTAEFTTIGDLVQDLNSTNRNHLDHSTMPLRDIKSACGADPRQLLFDTLVIWQQTLHSYDHIRKHVSLIKSVDSLEFNLTLEVIPGTGNIELRANYQRSVFPASQIDLFLKQVEQLSQAIILNHTLSLDCALGQLSNEVLSIENEYPLIGLKPGTLCSPVERIATEDPHRTAIHFANSIKGSNVNSQKTTYSQLNSRGNQIGHYLLSLGVQPDELICICMEKSVTLYESILASAKVGAGYLPVIPDTPAERIQYILEEAKVKIVLAQSHSRQFFKSIRGVRVCYVDELDFSETCSDNIPPRSLPDNVSYCVFTSGSTGTPKGVLVTQGNLLSNLDILEDLYPATKEARLLQSCSQAFDVSVFEIFFTWRIGGCLCSAIKDVIFRDIENTIRSLEITHLSLTPTVAALIDPKNVPCVQFLVTAGEAVTPKVFNSWADRGLYQGYGPSETTNICTVRAKVSKHDYINNIGPPFKNTSAFVLSPGPDFAVIPRGGEGEFCFGGPQVFRGYMDPNQNIGKVLHHPTYGKLYRSGDFGRLMPDGSLAFTSRKDDQVKIRGQRVELGEINNVMLRSDGVRDCVTMLMSGSTESSQRLVCFWTSRPEISKQVEFLIPDRSDVANLYKTLEAALPPYMIPSSLVPISHLPTTLQGKIDKRHLTRLYNGLDVKHLDLTAQASNCISNHIWTITEQIIAKVLAQYTKIPVQEISPDTSFFTLGIDSISAIPLSRLLREALNSQIDISEILKYPSIKRLGDRISDRGFVAEASNQRKDVSFSFSEDFLAVTTEKFREAGRHVEHITPCTPLQEAMLSAAASQSESLYSNSVTLNVSGSLAKLEACWQEMARRHEILRTCFVETDNPRYAYAQVVVKAYEPTFITIDTPKDISRLTESLNFADPPYGFGLVKSAGFTRLVISMHHALYDGIALEVLYSEVEKLYHDQAISPAVSFTPFLEHMLSINMEEADQFWHNILTRCTPTRINRINTKASNHTSVLRKNAAPSLSWIGERSRKHGTSILAVCQAVWATLISEHFQETDVCFGNVVSGRTIPIDSIERLVAPCFNTIPARLEDMQKLTFLDAFRKMQNLNADSLLFQFTPLRRIQSKFSPDGLRLFDTIFILQQPSRDLDPVLWSISEDNGAMDFPLVCEVAPNPTKDALEIVLHSHSSYISAEDASVMLVAFNAKLQTALENPRRKLLSSAIKDQVITKSIEREASKPSSKLPPVPMTSFELKIRDIISSFTDISTDKITSDISFFRLGLDSINIVQLSARLRKQGLRVVASDVLEHPTIAQLSAHLSQNLGRNDNAERVYNFAAFDNIHRKSICTKMGISSQDIEAVRPCTAVQQGMIAQTLHSRGEQYINSVWFELLPETSISKLKEAWMMVCRGQEMLRSGFVQTEDPKVPFALVTYAADYFLLPWLAGEEEAPKIFDSDQLARYPWNLSIAQKGDRTTIRFIAHHALYDAHSMQLILSDVIKAYKIRPMATQPPINSLLGPILIHEQDNVEAKKSFWQQDENKIVINHFPNLTPLQVSEAPIAVRESFSNSSTSGLDHLCKQRGVTLQAAGQAAWARLLTAYTGEASNTFGITLSGRSLHDDADRIPFPSIVTLPVRGDVTGTNGELLSRTMKANASLHKYQFTPLTSIQRWAGPPEGNAFDTLFTYQKLPDIDKDNDAPWKVIGEEASVDYAVSLEIQPTPSGRVILRVTFRESLIPVEHAEILLRQYDALLLDVLENPESACDVVPTLRTDLLSITPAREPVISGPVSLLHEFLERGAYQYPEKSALEFATCLEQDGFQSRSWTYTQVNEESNKIAQSLCKRGIRPGQLIAICFDKCPEASFAIAGILKAGCAYVALDPNAPPERIRFIMKDSGAKLILTAGKPAQNFELMNGNTLNLDSPDALVGCTSDKPKLSRDTSPQDTCYCLYTSGTTGTPKGCLITHENAVQAMYSFQRLFSPYWTKDSKWLQFASFHFDVSVLEQFWSWSVGICVASAPRDLIFEDIPGAIQRLEITHIDLTPSLARLVHPEDVPALCKGVFITGGEQLRQDILDVWGEYACIYNGYGPTEATIGCTMYPRVPRNGKPCNIGPQFDNVGSYVLKPNTEMPVFRGGIGELCVSGKLVGKGYLNRSELTREKFPTLQPFNERVYRTGDLVRILYDGSFMFLGRADDQVKLRGQRIELSEINQVIKKSIEDLEEVVTLVLRHQRQQKEQLVSFFVVSVQENDKYRSLIPIMKDACRARLPGYMVPTHYIPIDAVPLNANNKADARQLAALFDGFTIEDLQKLGQSKQEKAWVSNEIAVLEIIARVLEVEMSSLTKEVSIFELGLDSISIIGFSHALQATGLVNAKLSVIKNHPTMEKLVEDLMSDEQVNPSMANAVLAASQEIKAFSQKHMISICQGLGVESSDIEKIVPCTPVQQGMIYRFLESQHALYFHSFNFRLDKATNTRKLLFAWKRVVQKLEILRTKFVATDDGYAQVVMKNLNVLGDQTIDYEVIEKSLALESPQSFAITSDLSENILSLRIFHGLYDGNSLNIMLQRLISEYHGVDDVDYGPSFHLALECGPLAKMPGAEKFWREHLQDWSFQSMPRISTQERDILQSRTVKFLEGFEMLRRKLAVSHQALIQASWLSALQSILSSSLTIGMVVSGRTIDFTGADKVIGPLFNTLPLHVNIDKGMTAASLITRCHDLNMNIQDFQHTALKDIQKWSPVKPGQSLFDTLFVFLRPEVGDEEFANGVWTQLEEEQRADYPLAFEASLSSDSRELRLTIVAQSSCIIESQAIKLLDQFEHTMNETLKEAGKNVVYPDIAAQAGTKGNFLFPKKASSSGSEAKNKNKSFNWTQRAIQIRQEIASLAKIDEDNIVETSSIFELGLDSIDVIKLSSRLNKRGIAIPVSAIIKSQTIASISAHTSDNVNRTKQKAAGESIQDMSRDLTSYLKDTGELPNDTQTVLPATPLQQSMANEMIKSDYTRYFTVEAFEIADGTDISKLLLAADRTIQNSPILRTTFVEVDDPRSPVSYAQIIHKSYAISTEVSNEQSFTKYLNQFKMKSKALAASGQALLHIQCISERAKYYLIMAISHALYDGKSLQLFHDEIKKAYHGNISTRPDPSPYLEVVFQSTTEAAKRFWRSALSNLPVSSFPRKESSKVPDVNIIHRVVKPSQVDLKDIESFCRSTRITMQTLGQTCWAMVLSQLMGQLDVVFGSVLACRDSEDAEEVMFPLMNTVAVRSVLHGTVAGMLGYMQDLSDNIRQYQHFPLGTAQAYALASRKSVSLTQDTTLFDTLFIYQGRRPAEESDPLYKLVHGSSEVELPVCVEMETSGDNLFWTTACKATVRTAAETSNIISALDSVLQHMIGAPQEPVIVSNGDGISVCGLQGFQKFPKSQEIVTNIPVIFVDEEWSDLEQNIRKALHDISGAPLDEIQRDTTIFHVGLDSILALKLPALLRQHGIRLSVSSILKAQTVGAMAQAAQNDDLVKQESLNVDQILTNALSLIDTSSVVKSLEIEIGQVQIVMPVTAGQEYMIRSWQASQGTLFYPTFDYRIQGRIDKEALTSAWKELLVRNAILRTGFVEIGSMILQVVYRNPQNDIYWQTQSITSDIRFPPVSLAVNGSKLKLQIHHALYDGISLPLLMNQLQLFYRRLSLPGNEFKFNNFIARSVSASKRLPQKSSNSPKTLSQLGWELYLKHTPLHLSQTAKTTGDSSNRRTEVFYPSLKTSPLKGIAQDSGVSIDALLLAAMAKVYAMRLDQGSVSHFIFGIYLANRAPFGEDLSQLAAPTLNLLPVCVRDPLSRGLAEVAKDVQKDLQQISSAEMSSATLKDIWEWCGIRVDFFVNILKDAGFSDGVKTEEEEHFVFDSTRNLAQRAEVVDVHSEEHFSIDERHQAYLPSVDIEIRYQESGVDVGIFGPTHMVSVDEAEDMIRNFVGICD